MPTPSLRPKLLVLALSIVALAPAQMVRGRTPGGDEENARQMRIENEALALVTVDARLALRRRDYPAVERIVRHSRALTQSVGVDNVQADEILAEAYLDQGRYDDALGQIVRYQKKATGRLAMTLAAADLGAGNRDAAGALVERCYGLAGRTPLSARQRLARNQIWVRQLPVDRDPSGDALAASVWLLRGAAFAVTQSGPEVMADLERALRLAPSSAQIHLTIARTCVDADPDRAEAELRKAMSLGDAELRKEAESMPERIARVRRARDAAKAGGTKTP